MLAKHIQSNPLPPAHHSGELRLSHAARGPRGRGAEAPMEQDESPLEAIACGLLALTFIVLCFCIAAMGMPR